MLLRLLTLALALIAFAAPAAAQNIMDPFNLGPAMDDATVLGQGIAYADGDRMKLDIYGPKNPTGPAPVVMFIYGGSWKQGQRQDYQFVGRALAANGFVVVIPDYRLYPEVTYPSFLEDLASAAKWTQDNIGKYGGDTARFYLAGHSAGAYNAVMLGLDGRYLAAAGAEPKAVKALAGLSGPYDFLPLRDPIPRRTFGHYGDLPQTQPATFVRADSPPAFLATGDADTVVYPRNTTRLARALREAGVEVEERHYAGVDHVRMVLALSRPLRGRAPVLDEMTAFLHRHAG